MGKLFIFLAPLIVAFGYGWLLFYLGKKRGAKITSTQVLKTLRLTTNSASILEDASNLIADLLWVESVDGDDIITDKTRKELSNWKSRYNKDRLGTR